MLSDALLLTANVIPQGALIVMGIIIAAIIVLAIILTFVPLGLWISALAAGVRIGIFNLMVCGCAVLFPVESSIH